MLGGPGDAARFRLDEAAGCAIYPEVETNARGAPSRGSSPYTEVRGLLDAHMHMMGYEYFGGEAHCGRPWHR